MSITWSAARIDLAVVLDDEHRVAEVAQREQRREQARVVALVQPDRRLVEDVEHADEPRADLRREADALSLAARERRGAAVERQVVEADVDQEAEPRAHLLQDRPRDLRLLRAELEAVEEAERVARSRAPTPPTMLRPPTRTKRASRRSRVPSQVGQRASRHQPLDLVAEPGGARLALPALEQRDDAGERPASALPPRLARHARSPRRPMP